LREPNEREEPLSAETIFFTSGDGLQLEGRLAAPDGAKPKGGMVLCHPHPQFGGSMSSKLIPAMQRAFLAAGWAALRFNFRGVGRSEGTFEGGVGEVSDVLGALQRLRLDVPEPTAVVGWSFGSLVAMNAVAEDGHVDSFVGIAPPVRAAFEEKFELPPAADLGDWKVRSLFVCGTADPFCRPADLKAFAARVPSAEVRVIDGADHFFSEQLDDLCAMVVGFVDNGDQG
jgi:alpha/beta superfamily hydrolase